MTSAANAGTVSPAGYQAGNGAWTFRYVTTTFSVPLKACGADDFVAAGVDLVGNLGNASVAVVCNGRTPTARWGTSSLSSVSGGGLIVANDDNVTLSVYYDSSTGFDYFYAVDHTAGTSATWAHKAGVAQYRHAFAGMVVNNPLMFPPSPGNNYVLVGPFTNTTVTSSNGTRGTGIKGPWGYTQIKAYNGAHLIAAAPVLYNNYSTFNGRIYGNS